jgi:TonB family protein
VASFAEHAPRRCAADRHRPGFACGGSVHRAGNRALRTTSERRRRAARSDLLRGTGSGWLISIALHAGILCAGSWLVARGAEREEIEPETVVAQLDLRLAPSIDRTLERTALTLPEASPIDRSALPDLDDGLVTFDDELVRDDAIDHEFALEAAASVPVCGARDAFALDARASGSVTRNGSVRLPQRSGTARGSGARAGGTTTGAGGTDPHPAGGGAVATLLPPALVAGPAPGYPDSARRRGAEGDVRCRMRIDALGCVIAVEVIGTSGSAVLDEAARTGLMAWRFRPAMQGGVACACIVDHVVTFRLVRVDSRS